MKQRVPACDVHRHLGGSIPVATVQRILSNMGREIQYHELVDRMTYADGRPSDFETFLNKFTILDEINWDKPAINEMVDGIADDLYNSRVEYAALSMSINKYERCGWAADDIIKLITEAFNHKISWNLYGRVRLLIALPYHAPREIQIAHANLIHSPVSALLAGIDLVGNERYFDAGFYGPLLQPWKDAGKMVRVHVGEHSGTEQNVSQAIHDLPITNIAHGLYGSARDYRLAAHKGICFDLALTSNRYTMAVEDMSNHPMRSMLAAGCMVTLDTDDPVQFCCFLGDEFDLAAHYGLASEYELAEIKKNAYTAFRTLLR